MERISCFEQALLWNMEPVNLIIAVFLCLITLSPAPAGDADLDRLLDGVEKIAAPGVPGPFCLFGKDSFSLVTGKVDRRHRACVVAAARWGQGRVVAFGHTGYFGKGSLDAGDTARLVTNALRWTGRRKKPRVALRGLGDLKALCEGENFAVQSLEGAEWLEELRKYDVLCIGTHGLTSESERDAVAKFVRKGGGLLAGGLGWGWGQLNPGKSISIDHPGNQLLAGCGLVWADGYMQRTADVGFAAGRRSMDDVHALHALEVLEGEAEPEAVRQAAWVLTQSARSVPPDDRQFLPRIKRLLSTRNVTALPGPDAPLKDLRARTLLTLQLEKMRTLSPGEVEAHPAARLFPGEVPKGAKKVSPRLKVDTSVPGWHGTGLYALPGKGVKVKLPEDAAGQGLKVRIGAHSDGLWHHDAWKRCPEICAVTPLDDTRTVANNAFGGLVYIEVPFAMGLGEVTVQILNAVPAPRYVLDETDLEEWRSEIRHFPAPWAELESGKVALTLPSEQVRNLEDPEAVMRFWDEVLDACAELSARPLERERPERFVTDVQISAGYMHSGYPIMTHLDIAPVMVDVERMKAGGHGGVWGLFHELGHNHQSGDWTFAGTGEVTCNLFTLYVFDKVCGMPVHGHKSFTAEAMEKQIRSFLDGGAKFDRWKREPFLALIMYIQLQEAFGWGAFMKVIAGYKEMDRPENDDEKRDAWMVRFSEAVGRNLGPFFQAWGLPVSKEALDSIGHLPGWMPDEMSVEE
jgi:hypothetical protein